MRVNAVTWGTTAFVICLFSLSAGCKVSVDLQTAPNPAFVGRPEDFAVSVSNQSNCPVGDVQALVFPFIPTGDDMKAFGDDSEKDKLSSSIDAFCSGQPVGDLDGIGVNCTFISSDVLCRIQGLPGVGPGVQPAVEPDPPISDTDVTCASGSDSVACRIPGAMLQAGVSASSQTGDGAYLSCNHVYGPGPLGAVCSADTIGPGMTAKGLFQLETKQTGVFHNWAVVLAEKAFGVCSKGTSNPVPPNTPCQATADCTGSLDACLPGICVQGSSSLIGYGCAQDTGIGGCGTNGKCQMCGGSTSPEAILATIDCTTTRAFRDAQAPMLSKVGLLVAFLVLSAGGFVTLRRRARRRSC
jgi:hypothetical protein